MTVRDFYDYFGKLSPCRFCAVSKLLSAKFADDIALPGNAFSSLTLVGKGLKPIWLPAQPGCWTVAPLLPQLVQRTAVRSLSLEASGPHRMTATAQASGA